MDNRYAIILAAGQGKRMKASKPKVLHTVCGKPMVSHVVGQVQAAGFAQTAVVIGHEGADVQKVLGDEVNFVWQKERLGTGHAVKQAESLLGDKKGVTLVISADTPMISAVTMQALSDHHEHSGARATVLTVRVDDPTGLGRVIRDPETGDVQKIVEHKDASAKERGISEINTATYCIDNEALFSALREVTNDNAQQEYYLPDVIEILKARGAKISAWETPDAAEALGINDRVALADAEKTMQRRINEYWMKQGVTFVDPDHTYVSVDTELGSDTTLYPGTMLRGQTVIGEGCEIGPHSDITDSRVADFATIKQSTVSASAIGEQVHIGPFAHIRPETSIARGARVGNFVEIKNSEIGKGSKANHLSYIGDAKVGDEVNLGSGAVTVNYDGDQKHVTTIEDGAFIGCNANLVAPVTIGKNSFIAAGSTITENVPGDALSIARARQTNKEDYLKGK